MNENNSEHKAKSIRRPEPELKIKTRNLPHWTFQGSVYFVTFRTKHSCMTVHEQKLVLEHIKNGHKKFYDLVAITVMPDHVHLLLKMLEDAQEMFSLGRIMKGIKGPTARVINSLRKSHGAFWLDEYFDRIVRDQKELDDTLDYMLYNPVNLGLTEDPWSYHGWYSPLSLPQGL